MNRKLMAKELLLVAKDVMDRELKSGDSIDSAYLARLIETQAGSEFKANWTGAWDRYSARKANPIKINRGNGFEDAIKATGSGECFIYIGPFEIENMPSKDEMLLFHCDDAIFVKEK